MAKQAAQKKNGKEFDDTSALDQIALLQPLGGGADDFEDEEGDEDQQKAVLAMYETVMQQNASKSRSKQQKMLQEVQSWISDEVGCFLCLPQVLGIQPLLHSVLWLLLIIQCSPPVQYELRMWVSQSVIS